MNTVIFKWNPGFSSYSMFRNLQDIINANIEGEMYMNWSAREWEKISLFDRWYMAKVGYGATGIVAAGKIVSNPYRDEDWSGQGRVTYYADMKVEIWINPDALPILTSQALTERIPDFDWDRGYSGAVLPPETADKLNALWDAFISENSELFAAKAESKALYNDKIFWDR